MEFILWVEKHLPHKDYKGIEIDRIDNSGNYSQTNLHLASRQQQVQNRRNTVFVIWNGNKIPIALWKENPYKQLSTVHKYIQLGLTGEEIIQKAWDSVNIKCKNWKTIKEKLESTI